MTCHSFLKAAKVYLVFGLILEIKRQVIKNMVSEDRSGQIFIR